MSVRVRPARGFTLVEVLVALVIVAFGMGAVLSALTSAADSEMRLREKTFAEWVGFNQLSTTRLQAALPSTGDTSGEVDFASSRWQWQQTVTSMDIPGLRRIVVRVRRTGAIGANASGGNAGSASAGSGSAGSVGSTSSGKSATSDDKNDWLATVMGFRGDALQTPLDVLANWDSAAQGAAPGDGTGPGNTTTPGGTPAPGSSPAPGATPTRPPNSTPTPPSPPAPGR